MKAKNTSNAKNVADNDLLNPFRAEGTLPIDTATSNPIQEVNYFPCCAQIPKELPVWITNELTYNVKSTSFKRRTFSFLFPTYLHKTAIDTEVLHKSSFLQRIIGKNDVRGA